MPIPATAPFPRHGKEPKVKVLINTAGGGARAAGADLAGRVAAAFRAAGADAELMLLDGGAMAGAVRALAASETRLVVAGGDGTISCAAGVLAGSEVELAVLPLGTLNHLARDAGIPADLPRAAHLAVNGAARPVDTVTVGEHTFVNNASIGLYPRMVRTRDRLQDRGWSKRAAALPAAWAALTGARDLRLAIDGGAGPQMLVTPLLFVGNNRYSLESGSVGRRSTLDGGDLGVLAVRHRPRLALAWFALRAIFGRSDHAADFETITTCRSLRVSAAQPHCDVALDGEVQPLPLPLEFTIRPGSLRLVAPP